MTVNEPVSNKKKKQYSIKNPSQTPFLPEYNNEIRFLGRKANNNTVQGGNG